MKIIVGIYKLCNFNKKMELLTVFEALLKDKNEKTICIARRYIGPIIIQSPPKIITLLIIEQFVKLSAQSENDLLLCAQYLPAILLTLGDQWWDILKQVFKAIVSSKIVAIKEVLASSLHEYFAYLPIKYNNELIYQYICLAKDKSK